MKRKQIQINGKEKDPEKIYLDELSEMCRIVGACPNQLKSICRGQCERFGYVDCDVLNSFIKDLRGVKK
ncbi:MAG: hypothetical protein ACOC22_02125 [bacterium]